MTALAPQAVLMTDSKGMYDKIASELPSDDKASAAEAPVIREFLELMNGRVSSPHDRNPADVLTMFRGAHAVPPWRLLSTGRFLLNADSDVLKDGLETRQELGYNPRRRVVMRAASRQETTG